VATASYDTVPVAAAEHSQSKIYGVTWNPAAEGSSLGQAVLKNFLVIAADLSPDRSIDQVIDHQIARIREQIGDKRALVGSSGGVDSAAAGAGVQRAVGDQLHAVHVS